MKKLTRHSFNIVLLLTLIFMAGCKPKLDLPRVNPGDADFTSYVAVGGTYSAGFADGALTLEAQNNSVPALIARQFQLADGGSFRQPIVNAGNGFAVDSMFNFPIIHGRYHLLTYTDCKGHAQQSVEYLPANLQDRQWIGNRTLYNNLSVPGAKAADLYSQYFGKNTSIGNPYYARFASDTGGVSGLSSTVLGDASLLDPTFFSLWIGSNDILLYALAGGERAGNDQFNPAPANNITDEQVFNSAIDTIIKKLTSGNAEGVVADIPEITDLPFFRLIPFNGLILSAQEAADLNASFGSLGYTFTEGNNNFIVKDGTGIRKIADDELLLFSIPKDSIQCGGWGTPAKPIPASFILDHNEILKIQIATEKFNSKIRSAASLNNLAFADMHSFFKSLAAGLIYNGAGYNSSYLYGGVFSLDGLYLDQRGAALAANVFLRAVNTRYKSNLPELDANSFPGIRYP